MKKVLSVLPYIILVIAMVLLYRELRHLRWEELSRALFSYSWDRYAMALMLLVLHYLVWSGYDWISLRQMRLKVPYVQIFRTTAVAFPITNMVGYSLITGFATRVKSYERYGVSYGRITQLILFNISTWWLGFLFLCGAFIIHAPEGKLLGFNIQGTRFVGIGLLGIVAIYLAGCWKFNGRDFRFRNSKFHLPSLHSGCSKILLSVVDNLIVGYTMYLFMPAAGEISFTRFMAYFLSAMLVALLSLVPAGLGVLEGVLLFLFRPYAGDAEILASLVLFRVAHYLLPALIAIGLEAMRHWGPRPLGVISASVRDESSN